MDGARSIPNQQIQGSHLAGMAHGSNRALFCPSSPSPVEAQAERGALRQNEPGRLVTGPARRWLRWRCGLLAAATGATQQAQQTEGGQHDRRWLGDDRQSEIVNGHSVIARGIFVPIMPRQVKG